MKRNLALWFVLFSTALAMPHYLHASDGKPLESCDVVTRWKGRLGANAVTQTGENGSNAVHITIPECRGGGDPTVGFYISRDRRGDYWKGTNALAFKVRGDGTNAWGTVSIIYNEDKYYRYYATFPVQNGKWTTVVIPWRDFLQRNFRGPVEEHLGEAFAVWFTVPSTKDAGHPLTAFPAQSFDVDDFRLVTDPKLGVRLPASPKPQGESIRKTAAKLKARQPVKIVVIGASITWGLKCHDPATGAMSAQLEKMLRDTFGYQNITVVNKAVGGFSTYKVGVNIGRWVYDEEPVDLLIFSGDANYNDGTDAEKIDGGFQQSRDNTERIFEMVMRRGTMELMYICNMLNVDGDMKRFDALADLMRKSCQKCGITLVDSYRDFQNRGRDWLMKNYYTANGDPVHYTEAGQKRVAELVLDEIVNASQLK